MLKKRWSEFELIKTDASVFQSEELFDGALCTFAIEIIPPWQKTLDRMMQLVKKGGRIGILGFTDCGEGMYSLYNPLWKAMAKPFGGVDLARNVPEYLKSCCEEVLFEKVYGGFYYLLIVRN